ncbi:MAG: helix-turn-helix domain-containing protein [Gemmatimonadaceae bacterium]
MPETNLLGTYLKDRRAKLDPATFGIPATRRRTPALRREEVAQRANVSATWYTWLEQGRGGAPSADVLDRIAGALALTAVEREHLFLLAQNRMPEVQYESDRAQTFVDELSAQSPDFKRIWSDFDVRIHGEGRKLIRHSSGATIMLEYSSFAVDNRPDLSVVIYTPATLEDRENVKSMNVLTVHDQRSH